MITLKGDKDGFSGSYQGEGHTWKVGKVYLSKGIGARWTVEGPFFRKGGMYDYQSMSEIIQNWKDQGVARA
jgi:hypothetical protein